jgi:glutathione S-transferase
MHIVIGTRNWSSWSLRPWLALKRTGAAFDETLIALRQPDTAANAQAASPSGKVPVLTDGEVTVWDSLAICEYLADRFPEAALWPADRAARAVGRSVCAEIHSGFIGLRSECPMDLALRTTTEVSEAAARDIGRIVYLCGDLRRRNRDEGPFLLGAWSMADAFLTPIATRFRTHRLDPAVCGDDGTVRAYFSTLFSTPEFLDWERLARDEAG